ncbi:AraC family transcriptional regulator [uncultured Fluviicola sp.]|uniref:helix-turn-helix domain-containing protein n=1 Tax=uncultured Fluviicola sp. TaxID=463303 RepID=UPI0025F0E70B|nr:AraC family transcriptional regulator [uncultured Fluviicola sp.]
MNKTSTNLPFNYSCHLAEFREGEQFVQNDSLGMVLAGRMELNDGERREIIQEGELYCVRKNRLLKFIKYPPEGGEFKSLSLRFDEQLLKNFSREYGYKAEKTSFSAAFHRLPKEPSLLTFMQSLLDYQDFTDDPHILKLKQQEALFLLLKLDPGLKDGLFDFSEPHKIDLEAFMQKNFHFNVQLERFAYLTGRSLSTFQRDFSKIFRETPSRWLLQKRLQEAYFLIKDKGKKSSEIYLDLGFEDLSHFSYAFKKQFGLTATELANQQEG